MFTEYSVTYRRDDHNDEWANEYESTCVRTEDGSYVYISENAGYTDFRRINLDNIIKVRNYETGEVKTFCCAPSMCPICVDEGGHGSDPVPGLLAALDVLDTMRAAGQTLVPVGACDVCDSWGHDPEDDECVCLPYCRACAKAAE